MKHIDFILFTHEHSDHYHLESLKVLIRENPAVQIFANTSVSSLLEVESVPHTVVQNGDTVELGLVQVTGIGEKHVQMHKSIPASSNTGFFIGERMYKK